MLELALCLVKSAFEPTTWRAYWETVVVGRATANMMSDLGLTLNAVFLARSRVMGLLRRELRGVLE
jgi:RNA polymerase sigma-70 factor (ECF subfamily)